MHTTTDSGPHDTRAIGHWLAGWAVLIFLVVVVGGATRLTESGLSITEWKPVTGVIPPLTESRWAEEFAKYQRIPQYERLNAGMALQEFKAIYLWEFVHRIIARLAGAAYLLPLLWFAAKRRIPRETRPVLALLLGLLALQGAMGWWMVKSGLSVRTEVSQYRLAAHLTVALVIYSITVWTAADLLDGRARATPGSRRGRALGALTALVFVTSGSGALVAGLRAGKIYNTFPLMGDGLVPAGYAQLAPWWRNLFENHAAVQFDHRVLATITFVARVGSGSLSAARRPGVSRRGCDSCSAPLSCSSRSASPRCCSPSPSHSGSRIREVPCYSSRPCFWRGMPIGVTEG